MRKYFEITKSQIKLDTAFSAWYWAWTFVAIFQLLLVYAFWNAVYQNQTTLASLSLSSMLTYTVIAMFLGQYVSGVGSLLAENIRDGSIAIELMRPYHLLLKLIAIDFGNKITTTFRSVLPILILAFFFLHIRLPDSFLSAIEFVMSAIFGILIGTQLDLIVGVLAFWTVNVWGLRVLRDAVLLFFTGSLIPISLFPNWLQTVSFYLPFESMVYIPVSIYTGSTPPGSVWLAILMQGFWLFVLFMMVQLIWKLAIRKIVIFGG